MAKKKKGVRFWALKIFIITLILTAGVSVISESLMGRLPTIAAAFIILFIIFIGVTFDMIGIAVATCEVSPFVAMASKKIRKAKSAIKLLKNADVVSNICSDVVGDICGIVSGATGVAVAVKVAMAGDTREIIWVIVISSVIAALTVAGKAIGKTIAISKNKQIVSFVSSVIMVFMRDDNSGTSNGKKQD